ncbi:ARF GTPase-activating protein GIT2 [Tupaia chinensis]|uniref:ARF GTPase-activating protein GIT2 n=1 Tax=Tupaia chinensis TaxID=246437 RepID=L9KUI5_TUPCH|nr:ARF GTPase-activating protein GIT2 [Tupaia chinensis]
MSKRLRSSDVCADCSGPVQRMGNFLSELQVNCSLYCFQTSPNKAEFIRAKYQMLAFVHRLPCRDDDSVTAKDLSKEKGNTPLHVASKAGQILQAELLAVYGADPGTQDSSGKTPVDYARQGGHHELAERLVEIQYELTDRLAFYLCGRKPVWLATQNHSTLVTETTVVPFLPVNPEYSSTRNQASGSGRQKLARFNAHEFATLVIDILSDAKRRQQGSPLSSSKDNVELILRTINNQHSVESQDNDQPDYDSVASDEDPDLETTASKANRQKVDQTVLESLCSYPSDNVELILRTINNQHSVESQDNDQPDYDSVASDEDPDLETTASKANRQKSLDSDLSDGPVTVQEFMEVKNALVASEAKIQQLMKVNNNLSDELRIMQKKLQTLQSENSNLRKQATTNIYQVQTGSEYTDTSSHSSLKRRPSARGSRPMSMYETGSGQKPYLPMGEASHPEESRTRLQPFPAHASRLEKQNSTPESDYDNTPNDTEPDDLGYISKEGCRGSSQKGRQRSMVWPGDSSVPDTAEPHAAPNPTLPSTEDVIRKTEQITKNIQELLRAAQENKHDSYIPCSERIHVAVTEMAALFPKKPKSDLVRTSLRLLTSSAYRLQSECKKTLPGEPGSPADVQLATQQVIQCAYDIAKAAKQLVTITTKENNN